MPIGIRPVGTAPIAANPNSNQIAGAALFGALKAAGTISGVDSVSVAPSLGMEVAAGTIGGVNPISGAPKLSGLTNVGTISQSDSMTGAVIFGGETASGTIIRGNPVAGGGIFGAETAAGTISETDAAIASASFGQEKVGSTISQYVPVLGSGTFAGVTGGATIGRFESVSGAGTIGGATVSGTVAQFDLTSAGPIIGGLSATGAVKAILQTPVSSSPMLFAPPRNPQYPLDISVKPRVLQPQFGQGYPTVAPDGQNVNLRSVTLKFAALNNKEFSAIDNFVSANINVGMYYLLPDESTPRLWTINSRTRRQKATVWEYEISLNEQPAL